MTRKPTAVGRAGQLVFSKPTSVGRAGSANRRTPLSWLVLAANILAAGLFVVPVFFAAWNAFKTEPDFVANGPLAVPHQLTLSSLESFWSYVDFTNKLENSLIISAGTAALGVLLSLLAGYALGIGRVRGKFLALAIALVCFAMPQEALIYPLYYGLSRVGLYDSQLGVILVLGVLSSTFGTYMLSAVLGAFQREIIEAAEIDGAGKFRMLWAIVVPIARPSLAVLGTFFFIWTWNDFLISLVLLPSDNRQTVSLSLGLLFGQFTQNPVLAAAATLAGIVPTLIFFGLFQRTLMKGVTLGAGK